jgi:uncharacterized protein with GYD domain
LELADIKAKTWGDETMPKFLVQASYTAEGLRVLQKDKASGRRQIVAQTLESIGARLEAMYFSLGEYDVVAIIEHPDHVTATAMAVAASSSGLVRTKTTPLLSIEETDQALEKSARLTLRPPT